ncbi:MAG: hypothetical protein OSJ72_03285 [Lachnospiraceae bacterium]|nr:hypothetical protein [Lachnospiraceae bacterium]
MKSKKNRFWLFIFSLCPGAGHMYLGFMKMGLSFLLGFALSIALVDLTSLDVLAVIPIVIYIYALFHANNIGALSDEQFYALEDQYLLGFDNIKAANFRLDGRIRSIAAVVLILIGISMLGDLGLGLLWNYVGLENPIMRLIYHTVRDVVPRVLIALAIIWFGIYLLRGKKVPGEQVSQIEQKQPSVQDEQQN